MDRESAPSLDLEYAVDGYVSRPLPLGRKCAPLHEFPWAREIVAVVREPAPPSRWFRSEFCLLPNRAWYEWHWARGIDPEKKREKIPAHLRQRIIDRDGYVCRLCGGDVEPFDVHLDHVFPRSLGGKDTFDNLQVAHSRCNIRKGNRV